MSVRRCVETLVVHLNNAGAYELHVWNYKYAFIQHMSNIRYEMAYKISNRVDSCCWWP